VCACVCVCVCTCVLTLKHMCVMGTALHTHELRYNNSTDIIAEGMHSFD